MPFGAIVLPCRGWVAPRHLAAMRRRSLENLPVMLQEAVSAGLSGVTSPLRGIPDPVAEDGLMGDGLEVSEPVEFAEAMPTFLRFRNSLHGVSHKNPGMTRDRSRQPVWGYG